MKRILFLVIFYFFSFLIFAQKKDSLPPSAGRSVQSMVKKKQPEILINTVTSQSTQLKIYFWCDDVTVRDKSRSEAYSAVSKYLEEKEIKIM